MLEICDLKAKINEIEILHGVNLNVKKGEIHAIMGTNGSGKSTLSKVLTGHPSYNVTSGKILFEDQEIVSLSPEERAHLGLFLAFQYPVEVPGVSNEEFLRIAYNLKQKYLGLSEVDPIEFFTILNKKLTEIGVRPDFLTRNVNEGFSGGEKKRNEILQMSILDPKLSILDEADSGLDIDALKDISENINKFVNSEKSLILITHYQRLLDYIKPDYVHIMHKGKIIKTGDITLAQQLEKEGYEWLLNNHS
uniref:Iron-sulfur cluster formation ABC transporter ATP-binding subunit n=1 Tax=Meringosphaera mediterranea TaxID=2837474 RepID=UPI00286A4BB9|nr:Iron-sulfur cluster formation ABC transporter ATP-binding subunit [Meringosphaera mediterranea]WLD05700.1 Iron-sulfur cluster formation ABC transporter ATP-binding subunit [Meringosphaera mediterranea]WLD05890.1 Iron-sulfur cluster formation ABC transporter ATP-binding subunit [Meringosphaera mediterranea]WLD06110.1 Iron-sulfur cluster formation ABC transporter ATP-binding subunit [Meringosphaera mediterranea]